MTEAVFSILNVKMMATLAFKLSGWIWKLGCWSNDFNIKKKKVWKFVIKVHGFCFTLSRQLNSIERHVFKENIRLHGASSYHLKEATELQKMKQKLEEDKILLLQEKVSALILVLFHSPPGRGPWSPGNGCKCTENNFSTARHICSYEFRAGWREELWFYLNDEGDWREVFL